MKTRFFAGLALLVACAIVLSASPAAAQALSRKQIYQQTVRGTVAVFMEDNLATGWLVDKDRKWVVTSAHVVGIRKQLELAFPAFEKDKLIALRAYYKTTAPRVKGKVVHLDTKRDLAIIELASLPAFVTALKLARESAGPGDEIHLVGNPSASYGMWHYTMGTVRQIFETTIKYPDEPAFQGWFVESQLPTNFGDSGAPVVNDSGEVIGVHMSANIKGGQLLPLHVDVREVRAVLAAAIGR